MLNFATLMVPPQPTVVLKKRNRNAISALRKQIELVELIKSQPEPFNEEHYKSCIGALSSLQRELFSMYEEVEYLKSSTFGEHPYRRNIKRSLEILRKRPNFSFTVYEPDYWHIMEYDSGEITIRWNGKSYDLGKYKIKFAFGSVHPYIRVNIQSLVKTVNGCEHPHIKYTNPCFGEQFSYAQECGIRGNLDMLAEFVDEFLVSYNEDSVYARIVLWDPAHQYCEGCYELKVDCKCGRYPKQPVAVEEDDCDQRYEDEEDDFEDEDLEDDFEDEDLYEEEMEEEEEDLDVE